MEGATPVEFLVRKRNSPHSPKSHLIVVFIPGR
jgi:hypothetical protein